MFCIKMTTINRRAKTSTKKESQRGPTDSEFTHDFIRDVANRFSDAKTVSNMSKVSKKFNQAIDISNNKQRFLTERREKIYRDQPLPGRLMPINQRATAVYKCLPNGHREGLYQELDKDGNVVIEGNYVNGKIEGILRVINKKPGKNQVIEHFYKKGLAKSLTRYENGIKVTRYDVGPGIYDFLHKERLKFDNVIDRGTVYVHKIENFKENPNKPFHMIQEFTRDTMTTTVERDNVKIVKVNVKDSDDHSRVHETRHKNGKLVFDMVSEVNYTEKKEFDKILSFEGEFLKITLSEKKDSEEACEEFYENHEKIGEINYGNYYGYLNKDNTVSREKRSFFRDREINATMTINRENYDPVLAVNFYDLKTRDFTGGWDPITLGHNI